MSILIIIRLISRRTEENKTLWRQGFGTCQYYLRLPETEYPRRDLNARPPV
ncbi:MAG: hypothetical protein JWO38_2227 [Gemmataceae bacterium]|nr:hypothetical protein [Gemmataceae bacterium]